jgi:hypothetical protein
VDDVGALGEQRVTKTRTIFDRTDVGVIVTEAGEWGPFEEGILGELRSRETPAMVVFNKCALSPFPAALEASRAACSPRS